MAKRNSSRTSDAGTPQPTGPSDAVHTPARSATETRGRTRSGRRTNGASGTPAANSLSERAQAAGTQAPESLERARTSADETTSLSMGSEPSVEDIRRRAYQVYLERGGNGGSEVDDWIKAERDLNKGDL